MNFWVLVIPLVSAYVAVGVLDHSRLAADGSESTVVGWAVGYMGISLVVFLVARLVPLMARSWDRNGTSCYCWTRCACDRRQAQERASETHVDARVSPIGVICGMACRPVVLGVSSSPAGFVDVDRLDDPATWRPLIVDANIGLDGTDRIHRLGPQLRSRHALSSHPRRTIATAAAVAAAHTDAFPSHMHTARID